MESYNRTTLNSGLYRLSEAPNVVMHNGIGYDVPLLSKLFDLNIDPQNVIDTLVLSRLGRPERVSMIGDERVFGHSLDAWGKRLGFPKLIHEEWTRWSPAMEDRCNTDTIITARLLDRLKPMLDIMPGAVELEHKVAIICQWIVQTGIKLDVDYVYKLASDLMSEQEDILEKLQQLFPPILVPGQPNKSSRTLKNVNRRHALYGQLDAGIEFSPVKVQEFNPASRQQVAERLITKYDWKPKKFTPGSKPEISEQTLGTLSYPEAKVFAKYLKTDKLLSFIQSEPNANGSGGGWLHHLSQDGRIHAGLNPCKTVTHRPSCVSPNLQQVPTDKRARKAFVASPGWDLLGIDAEGLELRCLAHYLYPWDQGAYAKQVVEGDVHSFTRDPIGRNYTKNVTYGLIYGAGNGRLGEIAKACALACGDQLTGNSVAIGRTIRAKVEAGIPAWPRLVKAVQRAASAGRIKALDGRTLFLRSKHSSLNSLLQSAGIIIIKQAMVEAMRMMSEGGYRYGEDWRIVMWVHDEWQIEVKPELAKDIGELLSLSFEAAGRTLDFNCPLSGSYKIGRNWSETH
jgi:DNA polymerase-1